MLIHGFSVEERSGSGTFNIQDNEPKATRVFKIKWSDAIAFAQSMIGDAYPAYTYIRARSAAVKSITDVADQTGPLGMIGYEWAEVTISYEYYQQTASSTEGLARVEEFNIAAEFLLSPDGHFRWQSDNKKLDERIGIRVQMIEINIEEKGVINPPMNTILTLTGVLNGSTFAGIATGHVLYLGATTRRMRNAFGVTPSDLTHKFLARSQHWNKAFRPGIGWEHVVPPPYAFSDLNAVLTPWNSGNFYPRPVLGG